MHESEDNSLNNKEEKLITRAWIKESKERESGERDAFNLFN